VRDITKPCREINALSVFTLFRYNLRREITELEELLEAFIPKVSRYESVVSTLLREACF